MLLWKERKRTVTLEGADENCYTGRSRRELLLWKELKITVALEGAEENCYTGRSGR